MSVVSEQCRKCVLYLEFLMLDEAFGEWCGFDKEHAMEDISYLQGVHDFAHNAVKLLEQSEIEEGDDE